MGRLIDRENVIKGLESLRDICNAKSNMAIGKGKIAWAGYANTADDAITLLNEQSEIVRCKDCKKHDSLDCSITYLTTQKTPNEWYCADGERRTE